MYFVTLVNPPKWLAGQCFEKGNGRLLTHISKFTIHNNPEIPFDVIKYLQLTVCRYVTRKSVIIKVTSVSLPLTTPEISYFIFMKLGMEVMPPPPKL